MKYLEINLKESELNLYENFIKRLKGHGMEKYEGVRYTQFTLYI